MKIPAYIHDLDTWRDSFQFFTPIHVRFSETDAFGHVNNTVAFVYFEQARLQFFERHGLMKQWLKKPMETMIVTADLQCDYIAQMKYGDTIEIGVKVDKLGTSSFDVHYVGLNNGEVCLTGRGTLVQVDVNTGRARPIGETSLAALQAL
ncbi:acyl-CoA thioesterase [Shouchella lonarensis]|uniref:Acyl-CoA thioester hydrolase n=1 Tax=Shouchella lonarensis TaxID=1464122 RepID=A0A1G6K365_9BACI|nr:thioesterase family protein [Shouchella lonarensis]SDC25065.1 acyl-CoA thioester hydrolase [Shouchella lonarensis]